MELRVELCYDEIIEVVQSFLVTFTLQAARPGQARENRTCLLPATSQLNWGQTRLSDLLKMHFHLKPSERES